ncbi:Guanine-nucleotide dissociation stimulator CDC25 [Penicillium argentinense]|uniref:Guanine-nucleotide dissociation stimulator CDC25 n=1 Tax=Penicillium argentinense TaxID=1131581 RepID=A0A9W9G2V4_9EURO|nr:Guanine-nucleotide dissociation stimulator CDC25 [Penicillium argentinense]KAJ5111100.1 Guanine-nucleotide dissociation stimulator CDC25 [Penicillium argentinense]
MHSISVGSERGSVEPLAPPASLTASYSPFRSLSPTRTAMSQLDALPARSAPPDLPQSYQAIFQIASEFPRFVVPYYPWWEDEATTVLWAFKNLDIRLVIRYGLFRDENLPRSSLLSRNVDAIDAVFVALTEPREHQLLGHLSHMQRVEEILRRSGTPPFQPVPWSWLPQLPGHSPDARTIAQAIEAESHFQLSKVAFEDIVRASLGYTATSVEWFLMQHTALYIHLLDHLHMYPDDLPTYVEVEKHLQTKSPFAHRAVVQCLLAIRPEAAADMPLPSTRGFEFVAGPIQQLFQDRPESLTNMLKICNVFAVRYRRQYINTAKVPWNMTFDASYPFLEDYLGSSSPSDLARTLTSLDKGDFASLSRQSIVAQDEIVKDLLESWQVLTVSVWECCSAIPDLPAYLRECAKSLLQLHNYHSLTAILNGLHKYAISTARSRGLNTTVGGMVVLDPILPPETNFLCDASHNYAAYRHHYNDYPGLPFLLPHLRDAQQNGDLALQPIFRFLQK